MNRLLILALILFYSIGNHSLAQSLSLDWSSKMKYTNSKDGYFKYIIGSNEERIFIMYNRLTAVKYNYKKANKKIKIMAFNKSNMANVASVFLRGDKKNKKREQQLMGMEFYSVFEKNGNVYALWSKEAKSKIEIYGEVYNSDLELEEKLKKVYSFDVPKASKKELTSSVDIEIVVLANKAVEKSFVIGSELHKGKDEKISFDYVLLDPELNEISKSETELPIVQNKKNSSFSTTYSYGEDGMIYLNSVVGYSLDSEDVKAKKNQKEKKTKRGELTYYSVLSMINPQTEEFFSEDLKFDGYTINGYDLRTSKNGASIYGFFHDKKKDEKGSRIHGIFHVTVDPKTFELSEPHFSYFTKELVNDLFKNDQEDKKKSTALLKKKKKKEEALNSDVLDDRFVIEDAKPTEDGGLVIFCSKMYNYSVTVCTQTSGGGQSCHQEYYCEKSNITVFRLDSEGEIVWAKNADRKYTHRGTSIYDLRVVQKNKKCYVIYPNLRSDEKTKKGKSKTKSGSDLRDNFEYVCFDMEDGKFKKAVVEVNRKGTKAKDKKTVDARQITVIDNEFFVNSSKLKMNPGLTAAGCTVSLVCWPLAYVVFIAPMFKQGDGYLGKIEIND